MNDWNKQSDWQRRISAIGEAGVDLNEYSWEPTQQKSYTKPLDDNAGTILPENSPLNMSVYGDDPEGKAALDRWRANPNLVSDPTEGLWSAMDLGKGIFKGFASGVTIGLSEFIPGMEIDLDKMSASEKAGYMMGEFGGILVPFGWYGKAFSYFANMGKYGAKGVVKNLSKMGVNESKMFTKTIDRELKKIHNVQQKTNPNLTLDEVRKKVAPKIYEQIQADVRRWAPYSQTWKSKFPFVRTKPYLNDIYSLGRKGEIAEDAFKIVQGNVKSSIAKAYGKFGLPMPTRGPWLNDLSKELTDKISSGIGYQGLEQFISTVGGKYGIGKDVGSYIRRYLGNSINMSAIMLTDHIIRGNVHTFTRGTPFDWSQKGLEKTFGESVKAGFMFPVIQGIPNVFFGSGHRRAGREMYQAIAARFSKLNYKKILNDNGEGTLRELLKMHARGGYFGIQNSPLMGAFKWKTRRGNTYGGKTSVLSEADNMHIDDVVELLEKYRNTAANKLNAFTSMDFLKGNIADFVGSIPRMTIGTLAFNYEAFQQGHFEGMSNQELASNIVLSAAMTRHRGPWGMDRKAWMAPGDGTTYKSHLADVRKIQQALRPFGLSHRELQRYLHVNQNVVSEIKGGNYATTEIGEKIEAIIDDMHPVGGRSGFKTRHSSLIHKQNVYTRIKKMRSVTEGTPFVEKNFRTGGWSGKQLDEAVSILNAVEFKDGKKLKDITPQEFEARIVKEMLGQTGQAIKNVARQFKENGLPIEEVVEGLPGGEAKKEQFAAGRVEPEGSRELPIGLDHYNKTLEMLESHNVITILENKKMTYNKDSKLSLDKASENVLKILNNTQSNMNKTAGVADVAYDFWAADNPHMQVFREYSQADATVRFYNTISGKSEIQSDRQLHNDAVKVFNRSTSGEKGFLPKIENYDYDWTAIAKQRGVSVEQMKKEPEFTRAELDAQLGPVLQLLKIHNNGRISGDPYSSSRKIDVKDAKQIADRFTDLISILPPTLREPLLKGDFKPILRDITSVGDINPRVVNSVIEGQEKGLWNIRDGKIHAPDMDSIDRMARREENPAMTENDIATLKMEYQKIYDAIGPDRIQLMRETYLESTDPTYKTPNVTDISEITKNFKLNEVAEFIRNADIRSQVLKEKGGYEQTFSDINQGLEFIGDNLYNSEVPTRINNILTDIRGLRDAIYTENPKAPELKDYDSFIAKGEKTLNNLQKISDPVGQEINKPVELQKKIDKNIISMQEVMDKLIVQENQIRQDFNEVVSDIVIGIKSKNLSPEGVSVWQDRAAAELSRILGDLSLGKSKSLDELIMTFDKTKSWTSLKEVTRMLNEQITQMLTMNKVAEVNRAEADNYINLANDKKVQQSSDTPLTIAKRYGFNDPKNPNEFHPDILNIMGDFSIKSKQANIVDKFNKKVFELLGTKGLPDAEITKLKSDWNKVKHNVLTVLSNRTRVKRGRFIHDGGKLNLVMNDAEVSKLTPPKKILKKYGLHEEVVYIDATMDMVNPLTKNLETKNIRDLNIEKSSEGLSSERKVNDMLANAKESGVVIPESESKLFIDFADGRNVDPSKYKKTLEREIKTGLWSLRTGFYARPTAGTRLIFKGGKDSYMKLSDAYGRLVKKVLDRGFETIKYKHSNGEIITIPGDRLEIAFNDVFEPLLSKVVVSPSEGALKLQFIFAAEGKRGAFNKWLASRVAGDNIGRELIEMNMVKRSNLIDGGTTLSPSRIVNKDIAKNAPDVDIQNYAKRLEANKGDINVTIVADEYVGAGTSIKRIEIDRLKSRLNAAEKADKDGSHALEISALSRELGKVERGEIPSLDNAITDGIKYSSREKTKYDLYVNGKDYSDLGGYKTIDYKLGENGLLGKGYNAHDPAVKMPQGIDMVMGETAAKEMGINVTPLRIPTKKWYDKLGTYQGKELADILQNNTIKLNIEDYGLGFSSKRGDGVVVSRSKADFESMEYAKDMMGAQVSNMESLLKSIDINTTRLFESAPKMLDYIKQSKENQGFTQTQGELSQLDALITMGVDYKSPIIRNAANRAIKNEYFKELNRQATPNGADMTIIPDIKSELKSGLRVELNSSGDPNDPITWRTTKRFGEISPDGYSLHERIAADGRQVKKHVGLENTTFVINFNGTDYLANYSKRTAISPLREALRPNVFQKDFKGRRNRLVIEEGIKDRYKDKDLDVLADKEFYKGVSKDAYKAIEPVLKDINRIDNNLTMKEMIDLLNGRRVKVGLSWKRLSKKVLKIVQDNNIAIGSSNIAIPLKGYDKGFHRIKDYHELKGLVKINHYDERVMHQRDNDGDKFYLYYQLPFEMNVMNAHKQSFMQDFFMLEKDPFPINIFGINPSDPKSFAGYTPEVGPSKYLDNLDNLSRNIAIIGDRSAYSVLSNLGLRKARQDGKTYDNLLNNLSSSDLIDYKSGKFKKDVNLDRHLDRMDNLQKMLVLFQNAVDIHGGTSSIMKPEILKRNIGFGETSPETMIGDNRVRFKHNKEVPTWIDKPMWKEGFGNPNKKDGLLEQDIADIILRTTKELNIMGSDVYEDGVTRAPEAIELTSAYYNNMNLFKNPTRYVVSELAKRYTRKKGPDSEQKLIDMINYFYKDTPKWQSPQDKYGEFIKSLKSGYTPMNFKTENRLSWENFPNPSKDWKQMFDASPQGRLLREVVTREVFKEGDHLSYTDGGNFSANRVRKLNTMLGSTISDAIDRVAILVNRGDKINQIAQEFSFNKGVDFTKFKKEMKNDLPGTIGRGAIRQGLHGIIESLNRSKRHLSKFNNEYAKNKLESLNEKIKRTEDALHVLEVQYSQGFLANKGYAKFKIGGGFNNRGFERVSDNSFVLYYKGTEAKLKELLEKGDMTLSEFNKVGFVDKGQIYESLRGHTYIEIKNPIIRETVSERDAKYGHILNNMSRIRLPEDVFSEADANLFRRDGIDIQKHFSNIFSSTMRNVKGMKPTSQKSWVLTGKQEMSIIDSYFKKYEPILEKYTNYSDVEISEFLMYSLIKPEPLMGKYVQIGGIKRNEKIDLPYYKVKKRITNKVFEWMRNNGKEKIVENVIKEWEARVRGDHKEDFKDRQLNYLGMKRGYDFKGLSEAPDFIRSLSGMAHKSIFFKEAMKKYRKSYEDVIKKETTMDQEQRLIQREVKPKGGCE